MTRATMVCCLAGWLAVSVGAAEPRITSELVFPLHPQHNHAPGIVECPNGDLLVSWYRGSGERSADDVAVYGARLKRGEKQWSEAFLMADTPGFPDCNTCLIIDGQKRLWLFWPLVIANSWESALTQYRVSSDYEGEACPKWSWQGSIPLVPPNFKDTLTQSLDELVKARGSLSPMEEKLVAEIRQGFEQRIYDRLGWQPRCKPTILPSGRMLLPLYTDAYSVSVMAISDDGGQTWFSSAPLVGWGNIQPAVVRREDGTLVAYMRENGFTDRVRVCESKDDGQTWGPVTSSELPNPGSGLDALRLANGHWLLIYNDTTRGRNSLAVSISDDEGKTWKWTRHLEKAAEGSYHYPAITQGADGTIHAIYSYFVPDGKSMKHAAFNEEWVQAGDG